MKRLLFLLLVISPMLVQSQVLKELQFIEETHDFGRIKETDGPAEFKFEFTNTSQEPITITNVRASCGCTTPGWTKVPVMPGKTGYVGAVYNPTNRPGPFNKTLTVTTDGKQGTIILRIQGSVEPKPRTIEDDFPTAMGGLRTKYRAFNMGKVYDNEPTTKEFYMYNQSDRDISFSDVVEAPGYITVTFEPRLIHPKEQGKILITYDGKAKNDLGFMSDRLVLHTDEIGEDANKIFTVYADLNEYFAPLSPEAAAVAPKLVIEEKIHDFGKVDQGATVSTTFTLKNDGKEPLVIRKSMSNCSCTIAALSKESLEPGEAMEMKVDFNTVGRRGTQQKSITVYSNDPISPVQRIVIKATISVPNNE
jgi:hypothetical protein